MPVRKILSLFKNVIGSEIEAETALAYDGKTTPSASATKKIFADLEII